jgi:SpoVK/Ycf46/Vps4 family AAA+-type ATPase
LPTANQLARLFKRISQGDHSGATRLALEIAEREEKRGHRGAAQLLRGSINPNGHTTTDFGHSSAYPTSALIQEPQGPSLSEVALKPSSRKLLQDIVLECREKNALRAAGIARRTTLLFWGPPGCGKTLTARALGHELGLPVLTARLSSVIGSYLGQTGASLRSLFSYAQETPCVLLLDELDALGRSRGRASDVGELDRVVISLLQELDHTEPAGLIVAATNLASSIDEALWRRFSVGLRFPAPPPKEIKGFARQRLKLLGMQQHALLVSRLARMKTFAAVDAALEDLRREKLLVHLRTKS